MRLGFVHSNQGDTPDYMVPLNDPNSNHLRLSRRIEASIVLVIRRVLAGRLPIAP